MLKIGLTGGIGSGKTTVAKIFEVLGVPVYYADEAARSLMNEDEELKKNIILYFGEEAYINGELNKSFISKEVFSSAEHLNKLNSFVHPATLLDAENWMNAQAFPYAIKEAAILFESGANKTLDKVIGVSTPHEKRIERLIKRNGFSREDIIKRMINQMDEGEKMKLCDYVINNNDEELLIPQVLQLHNQFLAMTYVGNK